MFLTSRQRQHACVIVLVVLAHAFAFWGLHKALHGKPLQVIVPARMLVEFITPAPPVAAHAPERLLQFSPAPVPAPRSQPDMPTLAVADATLTTLKPARVLPRPASSSPPAPGISQPAPRQSRPEVAQAGPQLPEVLVRASNPLGGHTLNPAPPYPAASRHLRESGRVVVRVLAGPDGRVLDTVLQRSSGFDRLDQVALETLRHWRFDPAAYRGQSETQWLFVPVRFVAD